MEILLCCCVGKFIFFIIIFNRYFIMKNTVKILFGVFVFWLVGVWSTYCTYSPFRGRACDLPTHSGSVPRSRMRLTHAQRVRPELCWDSSRAGLCFLSLARPPVTFTALLYRQARKKQNINTKKKETEREKKPYSPDPPSLSLRPS